VVAGVELSAKRITADLHPFAPAGPAVTDRRI